MTGMLESPGLRDTHRMKSRPARIPRLPLAACCLALLGLHGGVQALGFGQANSQAVLGRPLDFAVEVRVEPDELADADCLRAEVRFGDVRLGASQVRAQWDPASSGMQRTARVTTQAPVNEPIITVDLTVGCKARLSRQFVALADPPTVQVPPDTTAEASAAGAQPPSSRRAVPRKASPAAASPQAGPEAAQPSARGAPAPAAPPRAQASRRSGSRPEGARAAPPAQRPAARPAAPRTATVEQPRLRLDPLDAELFSTPSLQLSTALGQADPARAEDRQAAAALWRALSTTPEQAALEAERLRQLEQSLEALRQESAATRQALEGLQASLRQAQAERYANPLVYALLVLCLALAAGLVWMTRQRGGAAGAWWRPSAAGSLPADLSAGAAAPVEAPVAAMPPVAPPPAAAPSPAPSASPAPVMREAAAAPAKPAPVLPSSGGDGAQEKVAVEELIDLEQQAEFFIVLGQDESAIELLRGHLREHRDPSPLPYMKLLEIHKRRGDRAAYEEVREEFNRRFNAYAPSWDEDLGVGRSLEDYPAVIDRLQGLWETPVRAIEVLQASLLRGDESSNAFDLPAYRELLMLYGIARERVQLESTGEAVDLLLPLDEPQDPYATRLEPTVSTAAGAGALPEGRGESIDVHLDLEAEAAPPPAAPSGPAGPDDSRLIPFEPFELPAPSPDDKDRPG